MFNNVVKTKKKTSLAGSRTPLSRGQLSDRRVY